MGNKNDKRKKKKKKKKNNYQILADFVKKCK